jgi:hypothetical protein
MWGFRDGKTNFLSAVYDTVFRFDSTGRVCMACSRNSEVQYRNSMKIVNNAYNCVYLNRKKQRLTVKVPGNDSCTIFGLTKNSENLYNNGSEFFIVAVKGNKYLVNKNFRQMTFKPYSNIRPTAEPEFFVTENDDEYNENNTGLITIQERTVVAHRYSSVRVNTKDSLILACSAGLPNTQDAVYDYKGRQVFASKRHIHSANRKVMVQQVFEPKEFFVVEDVETGIEKTLAADELKLLAGHEAAVRIKKNWYCYDLKTMQVKPLNKNQLWKESE